MLACLGLLSFAWFIFGMINPGGALPDVFGKPSRGKVAFGYVCWLIASVLWSPDPLYPNGSSETEESVAIDSVAEQRYDSLLTVYSLALADGRYHEAEQGAQRLAAELDSTHEDADSLAAIAAHAEEQRLYADARALPASQLQENAAAYRDLATRYPNTPLYREKATLYERRVREAAARRARHRSASRQRTRRSTGNCGPSGRSVYRGPRGGCYYYTSGGNKSYVDRGCC